ncbi:hypothetical protein AA0323_1413 [Asaia siamensis NRIC 0323]|nr:hypothetical protein AA0323_1413 [Asaia siamensis NRIC 0323]
MGAKSGDPGQDEVYPIQSKNLRKTVICREKTGGARKKCKYSTGTHNLKAAGSNPAPATKIPIQYTIPQRAQLNAQRVFVVRSEK